MFWNLTARKLRNGLLASVALYTAGPWLTAHAQPLTAEYSQPAGELGEALRQFAEAADIQILFNPDLVRGRRAPALAGSLDTEAALERLLNKSGLTFTKSGNAIYSVTQVAPSAPVRRSPVSVPVEDLLEPELLAAKVIVTAQHRAEDGQDVPISVTAFGEADIARLQLDSLRDISRVSPGLFVSSFNYSSPTIAIRGGTNTFTQIGANKPVQIVVDDVFIPRSSASNFELFGLESIQVLKGPQGTLFGRNVTAGAVLIDSGKPEYSAFQSRLGLTIGNYNARYIEGLMDMPVGEDVAVRIAGALRERDGFGYDRLTGREQDDLNSSSVRAQIRARITPHIEARISADYSDDRNGGRTLSSIANGDDGDRRTSELGVDQDFARTQWGVSARLYADLPLGRLTSITAFRDSQSGEVFSNVGANYQFLTGTASQQVSNDRDDARALTQEIRYSSPLWDRGSFLIGAFYADEDFDRLVRQTAHGAGAGVIVSDQLTDQALSSESFAVFADGTLNFTDSLSLTVGARYTSDKKVASLTRTNLLGGAGSFSEGGLEASWDKVTPRIVLSWRPVDTLMAYASYTEGYTAGGFNTDAATREALTSPFSPETLSNKEIGVKSDWIDGRVRFNLSLFEMTYEDKQELYFNNETRILNIVNAAEATMKGAEIEAHTRLSPWLSIDATHAILDTEYDDFVIPGGADNTGTPLGSSPRNRSSVSVNLDLPVGEHGDFFANATYFHTADYFTGAGANPGLLVPGYGIVNLSAGMRALDQRWSLTGFVRNLQDTEYLLTPSVQTVPAEYLGEPRTIGVKLEVRF